MWVSRAPLEVNPAPTFYAGILIHDLSVVLVRKGRKRESHLPRFACVLVFKVMYFYICQFVCVGGQVWVLVCLLLVQCQGKFRSLHCWGQPTSFTHAAPWSSCTHQSGKTLHSACRWSRCVRSWWHQMTVTLPWGGHQHLMHVLCATSLPPEIPLQNMHLQCSDHRYPSFPLTDALG